jgi:hypothetical protein
MNRDVVRQAASLQGCVSKLVAAFLLLVRPKMRRRVLVPSLLQYEFRGSRNVSEKRSVPTTPWKPCVHSYHLQWIRELVSSILRGETIYCPTSKLSQRAID